MSEEITPALTKEEWKAALRDRAGMAVAIQKAWGNEAVRENDHALAALALIYQPFGFTREDVEWLNEQWLSTISTVPDPEPHPKDDIAHRAWEARRRSFRIARSLAARIAALLPPEAK